MSSSIERAAWTSIWLWTTSNTLFSGADIAFLCDTLAAEGRQAEFAKYSGRTNAIVQGPQAVGSLVGALLASYNMLLCFTVAGGLSVLAVMVAFSFHEPPTQDAGTNSDGQLTFFQTIGGALRVVVERPVARYLVIFGGVVSVFPFLLTYTLFQPYATAVNLPVALLGLVVLLSRGAAIFGSTIAHRISDKVGSAVPAVGDRTGIARAIGFAGLLLAVLMIPVGLLWRRTPHKIAQDGF